MKMIYIFLRIALRFLRIVFENISKVHSAMAALVLDAEYLEEIERARREIRAIIFNKRCAPIMLLLAWHDAGTYDARSKTGGPDGSIKYMEEYEHAENKGLKIAIELCEKVKAKHPLITYADIYQLAGVVAVEITGGPTIDFISGRKDAMESTPEGRLPDAKQDASHLRRVFYRMGLTDKDIVALSGGHTLGNAHSDRSGYDGAWTKDTLKFDNSYFVELLRRDSEQLKLPTDQALVDDPLFRGYVELYAKDEELFFADYAASHKKLSELGFTPKLKASMWSTRLLSRSAVVGTISAIIVMLSYFCELQKRVT